MKLLVHVAGALLAVVTATTALAASAPNKAKELALPASVFPKGVVAKDASGDVSSVGSGWAVNYHYRSGGRPYELAVSVSVFKNRAHAVSMFKELKSDQLPIVPKLKLPGKPYGDEQAANHSVLGGSELIVRKGSVIWMLLPQTYMVRGGKTYELTKAQTIALYEKYGRLQQRRIK